VLAGYEILEELGRGGMGVVYKARQKSLNRLVALKMLLGGERAGAERMGRFQAEAEAVARLQHPNIVQVYEVSEQGGLPYFSLEYLEGGSLAAKIAGKPQPPREVAVIVEILARAMACAHQSGIVHRDLKPSNILLGRDGTPKVTDFGLARDLEGDSGYTRSGTLLGTPSYMPPEQAAGRGHQVGPLADVYSLGAILYALLTGRPPFQGASAMETVELVRTQEPVPPRRLQPGVPVDLDTICLKCLRKEPHRRYESAGELADDLHRYLAGEPIRARPIGHLGRLWSWCRRNPRVAALTALVLALLVVVAVGSTVAAVVISARRDEAERERQAAEESAEREREAAEEARRSRKAAKEHADLALKALQNLINNVHNELRDHPEAQALRLRLMKKALADLAEVSGSIRASGLADRATAAAIVQIGNIYLEVGNVEDARVEFGRARDIAERMAKAAPESDLARGNLGLAMTRLGDVCLAAGEGPEAAREFYLKGLALREEIVLHPNCGELPAHEARASLADSYEKLGRVAEQLGEMKEAYRCQAKAYELRRPNTPNAESPAARQAHANHLDRLAGLAVQAGDLDAARRQYEASLAVREWLAKMEPKNALHRLNVGFAHVNVGDVLLFAGKTAEALDQYKEAVKVHRALADAYLGNARYQGSLANSLYRVATAVWRRDGVKKALPIYREVVKIREPLAKGPGLSRQIDLMIAVSRTGDHGRAAGIAEQLRKAAPRQPGVLYQLACCYALCAPAVALPKTDSDLTEVERGQQTKYRQQAVKALEEAVDRGFRDRSAVEYDPDLDPIRGEEGFRGLLKRLQAPPRPEGKGAR
jgi:serine/threonine-protein kinase